MSGEHGDGIVRSEFLTLMLGKKNVELMRKIKTVFDPQQIFNPGKLLIPGPWMPPLRYVPNREEPVIETIQDFSDSQGILRAAEKCNGSGIAENRFLLGERCVPVTEPQKMKKIPHAHEQMC